jgi:hypothetical protein
LGWDSWHGTEEGSGSTISGVLLFLRGMGKRTRDSTSCDASREGGAELMSKKSRGRKSGEINFIVDWKQELFMIIS